MDYIGGDAVDRKASLNRGPVPGAEAVPSASEILNKMSLGNNNRDQGQAPVPAWKKAREESLSHLNSNSIPEWQKSAMKSSKVSDRRDSTGSDSESVAIE